MCGIVVVARRPARREPPGRDELLGALEGASSRLTAPIDVDGLAAALAAAAAEVESVDARLRGTPGVRALLADRSLGVAIEHQVELLELALDRIDVELDSRLLAASTEGLSTGELEAVNAALRPREGRGVGGRARPPAHRPGGRRPRRDRARRRRDRGVHVGAGRAVGDRPARGARPGLRRAAPARPRPRPRPRRAERGAACSSERPTTRCSVPAPSRTPDGRARASSTRRRPRSVSSATTPPRSARRSATTRSCTSRSAGPGRRRSCSATRAGRASGSSPRPNAHPLNQRRARRRPTGPYVTAALNGDVDNFADLAALEHLERARRDHHRRQGDPRAGRAPARRRRGGRARRSGRRSLRSRDRSRSRAAAAADARRAAARAARERPGALRRPGRGLLRRRQRAVRPGRGDRAATCGSTARRPPTPSGPTPRRGQIVVLDAARAGDARRHRSASPTTAPTLPVSDDELQRRRDHDARHRPGRLPALPAEGDLRGAGVVPQDAARARSSTGDDGRLVVELGHETLPTALRERLRDGAIRPGPRHRPGDRGRRGPEPRGRARRDAPAVDALVVEAMPATELSGFGLRDDMSDTLVVAISQSGTTTDTNRTVDLVRGPRRDGGRDRQPAQQRPRRQVRRRALHVRRPRRRDERRVDEGLLRPDRGRLPARARARRRSSASPTTDRRTTLLDGAARRCPTRCEQVRRPARRRSAVVAQRARAPPPLLGGRRQRRQPHRRATSCGSSSRSSATSRSPATSPRTRSTSTSRPSR